ncbi:ATP-binding protein [Craterilacuibacter sp.]|uniref:ATP-binding protein n=1 Tax=Craterilacuibacter sp. TaxID=2870909 RepID=UPI003F2A629A
MKIRRWPSLSLLSRLILLVITAVLLTQGITLWLASVERHRLISEQLYNEVLDTLASAEGALDGMSADERDAYLQASNRPDFPQLLPTTADTGLDFRDQTTPMTQTLAQRLSVALGEKIDIRLRRLDGRREMWLPVHVLDQDYWLVMPLGRYSERPVSSLLLASLLASLLAMLLAFGFAWQTSKPLLRLSAAVRELGRGRTPLPLPASGAREIRSLAEHFNQMSHSLDETARERRLMLAGLSHDLRTPLTRLKLLLEMQEASPDQHDMLDDIDELSRIVSQFSDFARASETRPLSPTALSELTDSVATRFTRNGMAITLDLAEGVEINGDALALERLLSNLLENARRYGQPPFRIRLQQQGAYACLCVTDHGSGIAPELREAALAPFERLAAHRGTDGGSGLGLAIVTRIVNQHGGTLDFVDEADGGFTVRIKLLQGGC